MFKLILPALLCCAFAIPMSAQAQDCGCCQPEPACVKTRKKLAIVTVQKEVCRLQCACVVDECGCESKKLIKVKKCVSRKRLALVDVPVDPCKKGCIATLIGKLKSKCNSCCDCCEPTCGCEPTCAAEPTCGCDAIAAPTCGCD